MKKISKSKDYLLTILLAGAIISLSGGVISLWMVAGRLAYVILMTCALNAIMLMLLYIMIGNRYLFVLKAIEALDDKALNNNEFKNKKGFPGLVIQKLTSFENKINEATELITRIGEGEEIGELTYLQEKDAIKIALANMHDKITQYNNQEQKRKWIVEGVALFGEILRKKHDSETELGFDIITNLVRYTDCNQGGFFIINKDAENTPYLDLVASYAYDQRKYDEKKIYPGQGLLGQSMKEEQTIYMTKVPNNYVHITSGLGETTAQSLIIVPLLLNDEYCGAIELASFNRLQEHQIEFLEKVAENIASYVASAKVNVNTQELLQKSQTLTEELKSREEEMRQNLEELTAAQHEMEIKQTELDGIFNAIDATMGMAEFSLDGMILALNESLLDVYGLSQKEVSGKSQDVLLGKQTKYQEICDILMEKNSTAMDLQVPLKSGEEAWINASFTAVRDKDNAVYKVLMLAQDVTEKKLVEKEVERLSLVADNTDNSVIITDSQGRIEFVNDGFTRMTGYESNSVIGKKPGSFLQGPNTNPETIKSIGKQLKQAVPIYEEILNYNKAGESYWISLTINPVFDNHNNVVKFISIQADITDTKIKSLDYAYKLEAIGRSNAIIEFGKSGVVEEVNQNFLDLLGYKKEEIIGQHRTILVDKETELSDTYKKHWERLERGEYVDGEFKRLNKMGKEIWIRGVYNPVFDLQNKLLKIIMFAVDLTQEKKLQLAAQRQELLIKNQLDTINKTLASVEFDIDGTVQDANQIFLSIAGYEKKEIIGKPYTQLIPPSELDKPQAHIMWQNLKEGQFFMGEFKILAKSGKELWLSGTYNPIMDHSGKPIKVIMFAQFTTQEKEKQLDLKRTANVLKKSLLVMELNATGTFKNANELFLNHFGYKRLELRNTTFDLFLNGNAKNADLNKVFEQLLKDEFVEKNLKLVNKAGESTLFKSTFFPIKNLEDKISKIIVILVEEK